MTNDNKTEGADKAVEPDKAAGSDKSVEPDKAAGSDKAVEPDKAAGSDKAVEPNKTAGSDKVVEPDKAVESDKAGEPDKTNTLRSTVRPLVTYAVILVYLGTMSYSIIWLLHSGDNVDNALALLSGLSAVATGIVGFWFGTRGVEKGNS